MFILMAFCSIGTMNAQTKKHTLLGGSFQVSPISEIHSFGAGLVLNSDISQGEGWGYIAELHYLFPQEEFSDFIDYAGTVEAKVKYDFAVADKFEVSPNSGVGLYLLSQSIDFGSIPGFEGESESELNTEVYPILGGTATYQLTDKLILGASISYPLLDGAEIILAAQLLFKI